MDSLKDIVESRMYYRLEQLHGKRVDDLASSLFSCLLMLKILWYVESKAAQTYTKNIIQNISFDRFRTTMPDLYNILVVVMRQHKYADMLYNDWNIIVPELRIKRILRQLSVGELDENDYDQLLMILQRQFKNLSSDQIKIRRIVSSWKASPDREHRYAIDRLLLIMRRPTNSDLYMIFQNVVNRKRLS